LGKNDIACIRRKLKSVIVECPYEVVKNDCPFQNIRKMALDEMFLFIDSLSDDDSRNLLNKHIECMNRRKKKTDEICNN